VKLPAKVVPFALLALAACRQESAREPLPAAPAAAAETAWFEDVSERVGLRFDHRSGLDGSFFFPEHVGSGGALFDYDGDGDLDAYLVMSGEHGAVRDPSLVNRLFRQEADGRFVDRTAASGLGDTGYGMGVALGDADGDGATDVYVTNYGRDAFYRNRGDGTFADVTAAAGLGDERWATSACFFDADADGDLDLYVATYVHHDPPRACTDAAGRPEYCGPAAFRGVPDLLYRNDGGGGAVAFTDVSREAGIATRANKGLGLACTDLDGDHRPDVYVANDGEPNQLWINRGDLRFEDRATLLGAATNLLGKPEASMGVALGDVDRDGRLDLLLAHLDRETNTFYQNLGDGGFRDATAGWGLGAPSLPYTGFGAAFFDADLDGDLDLLVVNGRVRRGPALAAGPAGGDGNLPAYWRDYAEPNLFLVQEDGRFRDASAGAGDLCRRVEVSRGLMAGDVDRDGAVDVLLTNCNGPARLYRNRAAAGRSWLSIRTVDKALGADAVGAEVVVTAGGRQWLLPVTSTYGYLTGVEPRVHVGLGDGRRATVAVRWPDGHRQRLAEVPARRRLTLYRQRSGRP